MDILELITKRARRFKQIWYQGDTSDSRKAAFELCNQIRKECDELGPQRYYKNTGNRISIDPYTEQKFDHGFQYRTIFHEDWKVAKDEFINLVFGWW